MSGNLIQVHLVKNQNHMEGTDQQPYSEDESEERNPRMGETWRFLRD